MLCGCNPGLYSAAVGHYFARTGNAFWRLLAESGITPRLYLPEEDSTLPEIGLGLTDVVARPSAGTSDIGRAEWRAGGEELTERLRSFRPAGICFVGDTAYRAFSGRPRARWGLQPEPWEGITVFVVPSTSGRVARLAAERRAAFREAAEWLAARRLPGTVTSPQFPLRSLETMERGDPGLPDTGGDVARKAHSRLPAADCPAAKRPYAPGPES